MENNDLYELQRHEELDPQEPQKPESDYLIIEPQPRWRSWVVWVSVLGAMWTIANAVGLTQKWGIEETTFKTVVDALGVILTAFGILNNPTDKANF